MGAFYNATDANYRDIGVTSDDKMVYYGTSGSGYINKANVSNKADPKFLDSVVLSGYNHLKMGPNDTLYVGDFANK